MFELSDEIIKILNKKARLILGGNQDLYNNLNPVQQKIFNDVMRHVEKFQASDGRFVFDDGNVLLTNQVREIVLKSLNSGTYPGAVNNYLRDFDTIKKFNFDVHRDVNELNPDELSKLINPMQKSTVQNTMNALTGTGIDTAFIEPMRTGIYQNIVAGSTKEDLENFLRGYILGNPEIDGKLMHYVKQVSRDALNQFDGQVNAMVADEFGLDAYRYVGSIIADSRPQCIRWTSRPGGILLKSELPAEIAWMYSNGTGSIPGTNVENFAIFRGGYNCRHSAIPFKLTKSQRERLGLELEKQEKTETAQATTETKKVDAQIKSVEKQTAATQIQNEKIATDKKLSKEIFLSTLPEQYTKPFNDVVEFTNEVFKILNDKKTWVTLRSPGESTAKGTSDFAKKLNKDFAFPQYSLGTMGANTNGTCAVNNSYVNIKIVPIKEKIEFKKYDIEANEKFGIEWSKKNGFRISEINKGKPNQSIEILQPKGATKLSVVGEIKNGKFKPWSISTISRLEDKNVAPTITHELGHVIQNSKDPKSQPIMFDLMQKKGLKLSDAPTMYGETNLKEFWTESFTSYVYSNTFLKTYHPKVFELVEDYLTEMKIDLKTIKIAK